MATNDNPFDRLGKRIKELAEEAADRFRGEYVDNPARLMKDLHSLGLTGPEARRHVELVIATTM